MRPALTGPYPGRGVGSGCGAIIPGHPVRWPWYTATSAADRGGYRRHPGVDRAAICRNAGHPLRGDPSGSGAYGCGGLYVRHRGSGVTFKTGWAAYHAAQDIKRQMCERAAKTWNVPVERVTYDDGAVRDTPGPRTLSHLQTDRGSPGGHGWSYHFGRSRVNPPGAGASMGTHIVDVEVDPETGKVTILRYTVQDAGKAIHPSYVEGQIQGGAAPKDRVGPQRKYVFNAKGHMLNASFLDYHARLHWTCRCSIR